MIMQLSTLKKAFIVVSYNDLKNRGVVYSAELTELNPIPTGTSTIGHVTVPKGKFLFVINAPARSSKAAVTGKVGWFAHLRIPDTNGTQTMMTLAAALSVDNEQTYDITLTNDSGADAAFFGGYLYAIRLS